MIKLVSIDRTKIRYYVKLAFEGDTELLQSLHVSPGTLDHCVEDTIICIEENEVHFGKRMEFYAVVMDVETVIGYTILIRYPDRIPELYSFGINKLHRNPDNKRDWLAAIKEIAPKYFVVLWSKNTRAINFFEKNDCNYCAPLIESSGKTLIVMNGDAC